MISTARSGIRIVAEALRLPCHELPHVANLAQKHTIDDALDMIDGAPKLGPMDQVKIEDDGSAAQAILDYVVEKHLL